MPSGECKGRAPWSFLVPQALSTIGRVGVALSLDPSIFMRPAPCAPAGNPQVVTTEADGKRTIRTTGVFSGIELHMSMEPPHADDRCGRVWVGG